MTQTLPISLTDPQSGSASAERRFVNVEQIKQSEMDKTASMFDIQQMVARARGGVSAKTYRKGDCAASLKDGVLTTWFDFCVWPSSMDLPHTLIASMGNISAPTIVEEYTEFSLLFGLKDVVELDFILKEISSVRWETQCHAENGDVVPDVELTMDGLSTVRASAKIFGVARVRGKKIGAKHRLTAELIKSVPEKPDEPVVEEGLTAEVIDEYWGYTDVATWEGVDGEEMVVPAESVNMTGLSITNLDISVTARWIGTDGEEKANTERMEVAQCVKDLLAWCEGDVEGIVDSLTDICGGPDNEEIPRIAYTSGCTGKIIEVVSGDDDGWCG